MLAAVFMALPVRTAGHLAQRLQHVHAAAGLHAQFAHALQKGGLPSVEARYRAHAIRQQHDARQLAARQVLGQIFDRGLDAMAARLASDQQQFGAVQRMERAAIELGARIVGSGTSAISAL